MRKIFIACIILLGLYFVATSLTSCTSEDRKDSALYVRAKVKCITIFGNYGDTYDYGDLKVFKIDRMYNIGDTIQMFTKDWVVIAIEDSVKTSQ